MNKRHYTESPDTPDKNDDFFLEQDEAASDIFYDVDNHVQHPSQITLDIEVPLSAHGIRLDKFLAEALPEYSRARIQQWIEAGFLSIAQGASYAPCLKIKQLVTSGLKLRLTTQVQDENTAFTPEDIPLQIVFEDETILVVNKHAGLVVHPAAGNWQGTLLNGLLFHDAKLMQIPRAGIVHRLDKDTTGLLVVAKTLLAQTDLIRQLQARTVKRHYIALVWGRLEQAMTIDLPISRHLTQRTKMAVSKSQQAKVAITHVTPLAVGSIFGQVVSLVRCELETGRTHQIRVHLSHMKYPLVGDAVYGRKHDVSEFSRQALHAYQLGLVHPESGDVVSWQAELPADMLNLLHKAGINWLNSALEDVI